MSQVGTSPASFSLRDFVVDDDAANFPANLWQSIDHSAFVLAQREALEAFNVAKAMRLSQETAAAEHHRRAASSSSGSSSASASAAAAMKSTTTTILITPPVRPKTSSASDFARQNSSPPPASHHDRKPSSSASEQARAAAQPRLSLSITSSTVNSVPSTSASQYYQRSLSRLEPESPPRHPISMPPPSSAPSVPQQSSSVPQVSASTSTAPPVSVSASSAPQAPSSQSTSTSRSHSSDHKRRRTERQPSISSSTSSSDQRPQQPPAIDSKNSTSSVRLVNPPPTPIEPRSRRRSTAKPPTIPKHAGPRDLFMATRNCTKCSTPVPSPRSQSGNNAATDVISFLHVTCTKCQTMFCRGCFTVAQCNRALVLASAPASQKRATPPASTSPNDCSGGSNCTVRNCCAAVRAIAIFEVLSAFDDAYAAEAGFTAEDIKGKGKEKGREYRDSYVRQVVSGVNKSGEKDKERTYSNGGRRFEDAFVRTLKAVNDWLQVPEAEDGEDGYPSLDKFKNLHVSIPRLFASSLLLEVVCGFLSNTTVRDWVTHAETYLAILDLLRGMYNASTLDIKSSGAGRNASAVPWLDELTLKSILRSPLRRIDVTCGLRSAVWNDGFVRFEDLSAAGQVPASADRKSLCDLIRNLEEYRRQLQAGANVITFKPTLDKVSSLCDKIMYLLLMLVVDI